MVSETQYHVLIVGGGTAGITCAALLRRSRPSLKIAIIDPARKHYYQPMWTLVGAGVVSKGTTEKEEAEVIPNGVTFINEAAGRFEPEAKTVVTASGKRISYQALIVAAGIQINWEQIKGLKEALGKDGVSSNYSYEYVEETWKNIRNFKGGTALFTHPNTPIKCGGAPQKIMYLAEDYFRKQGIREKCQVVFGLATGSIFAVPKYAKTLNQIISDRKIDVRFQRNLVEVRPKTREAVFQNLKTNEEEVIPYDMLHVTPPMGPPDFIRQSALANEQGWVDVDKFTLQHNKYPEVFGLGDSSSLPTSKTGAAIRKQAPVVAQNIVDYIEGKVISAKYNGYTSCPLVTRYGRVVMAEFDYNGNPEETFPFDQSKERYSMYFVKRHLLPVLYWMAMLKGHTGGVMKVNVGKLDKVFRFSFALVLFSLAFYLNGPIRWLAVLGLIPLLTGLFNFCPLYTLLGVSTRKTE